MVLRKIISVLRRFHMFKGLAGISARSIWSMLETKGLVAHAYTQEEKTAAREVVSFQPGWFVIDPCHFNAPVAFTRVEPENVGALETALDALGADSHYDSERKVLVIIHRLGDTDALSAIESPDTGARVVRKTEAVKLLGLPDPAFV